MADSKPRDGGGEVVVDFAAQRRARLEAKGETFTFRWIDDREYELPSELPLAVVDKFDQVSQEDGMKMLFGEKEWQQFRYDSGASDVDYLEFQKWLLGEDVYDMGKYDELQQPSRPTGRSSKRTSKGSTK